MIRRGWKKVNTLQPNLTIRDCLRASHFLDKELKMMIDERGTVTHPLRCGQTVGSSSNPGNDSSNNANSQTSLSCGKAGWRAPWVGHQGSDGVGFEGAVYSEVFTVRKSIS